MKNIHNASIFNTTGEEAIELALRMKEQVKKKMSKVKNYSGITAALKTELFIDGGVVKTRPVKQNEDTNDQ